MNKEVIKNKKLVYNESYSKEERHKIFQNCTFIIKPNLFSCFRFYDCTFKNCKFIGESEAMESKIEMGLCKVYNCSFSKIKLVETKTTEIDNITFKRSYFDINW